MSPHVRSVMLMKIMRDILRPNEKVLLGRWQINYKEEILAKTIDRANEDHCGTCVKPPTKDNKKVG